MILFHFPPLGGVSMPRNVRNVQHLPSFGWTPLVLAPRDASGFIDPEAIALVPPGTKVIHARCLEPRHLRPVVTLVRRIVRVLRVMRGFREYPRPQRRPTVATTELSGRGSDLAEAPSRFWRLQQLVFFPDSVVGWVPFAVAAAIRAHRAGGFDAVYSTSAPVSAHLVAGIVKRLTGVAWVAEFRDPWMGNPLAEPLPWLHRRWQAQLERWIVHSADRLVFVSTSTTRLYRSRYPSAVPMVTITNGHDRSETILREAQPAGHRRYRIVWAGALYRPAELQLFLEALDALVDRRPALVDQLEVEFYGHVSDECIRVADRFRGDGPLGAMLHFAGFVPRRVALEAVADADASLVMLGPGPDMGQFVPGKLFECLGQSKQVLAVLPPGDARDILKELDWGVIADPNVADIGRAIERLLTLPPPGRLADPEGKYDRVALAGRLADTIRDASGAARGQRAARSRPSNTIDG